MKRSGKGSPLITGLLIVIAGAFLDSMIPKKVAGVMPGAGFAIMSLFACCFNMTIEEIFLYEELSSNNLINQFLKEDWI